jgi:hypothetical protein
MFHKYLLILTLLCGMACAEINIYDEPTPWRPLKKEHALFYSAVWTVIGLGFTHGMYKLYQALEKPTDSDKFMNDVICSLMIGIFAKMTHHSVGEVIAGLKLYLAQSDKQQIV